MLVLGLIKETCVSRNQIILHRNEDYNERKRQSSVMSVDKATSQWVCLSSGAVVTYNTFSVVAILIVCFGWAHGCSDEGHNHFRVIECHTWYLWPLFQCKSATWVTLMGGHQFSGAFLQLFGLALHKNREEQWKQSFIHCYPEFYQHYTIFLITVYHFRAIRKHWAEGLLPTKPYLKQKVLARYKSSKASSAGTKVIISRLSQ